MKKFMLLLCLISLAACAKDPYKGVSPALAESAKANIALADSANIPQLEKALIDAPAAQKDGMAFLISYMPDGDRDTLSAQFLLTNVDLAYKARETFAWAKELPDSIFYNEVLPYANFNETREDWRTLFWETFYPMVKDAKDVREAVEILNREIEGTLKVKYNTKRRKTNQSPSESMEQGMATCSGLSILLTDALRSVGIPSRIAGTPLWINKSGNHNWSEVWIDGNWYVTEYNPAGLNQGWFLDQAGRADKSNPIHWIYATSWKDTGLTFPMVWARKNNNVPAYDVTDFYINLRNAQGVEAKEGVPVVIRMFTEAGADRTSASRVKSNITVFNSKGEVAAVGTTASPTSDMNDYLTLYLPEKQNFTIEYIDAQGEKKSEKITTDKPLDVELFSK